jgi:anti-sigma regulatory factor (Ser/Thr protein kinase)
MRTGSAAGHLGYYHEAFCFESDPQLLAVAVPFLLDGVAAGEPALVTLGPAATDLVRAALPAETGIDFLTDDVYGRPTTAIRSYRRLLGDYVAGGAEQIRIIGQVPAASTTWDLWSRYESAVNHAYDDFPLWGLCAYDARTTPAPVLADVARTHPRFALSTDRHEVSPAYLDPVTFLSERRPAPLDPVQHRAPLVELLDPTPADARAAVRGTAHDGITPQDVDDLLIAVSEMVTNARRHGRGTVRVRLWAGSDRVVVTVTDQGDGPPNPFAGLLPEKSATGGLGLWITHQSCSHVAFGRDADGFTVRLIAGSAAPGIRPASSRIQPGQGTAASPDPVPMP